jgi:hypothetical protein
MRFSELLVRHGPAYRERFGPALPPRHREVLDRLLACRTPALGGELFACFCGAFHYRYHSCNDRHCPRCGQSDADGWLERSRQRLLLPVPYFLLTFTVPEPLRPWLRSHSKLGCDLLFKASAGALQDLAANPRRLGAQLGMLGVLHTWSRTLIHHPHVHYLVPGGGLSLDHRQWVAARPDFLFRVEPLSDRFRNRFKEALSRECPDAFAELPARLWRQRWIVHSQPAGSGEAALGYLSRYLFKTATGDRLTKVLPDGRIRWPYRESGTGRWRHVDLEPFELIRRFLQHVLPSGYTRVRRFGWLHPAARVRLNRVRALLHQVPVLTQGERETWQSADGDPEPAHELEAPQPRPSTPAPLCPHCQQPMRLLARWRRGQTLPALARPPP